MREHTHSTLDSTTTLKDTVYVTYALPGTDPKFGDAQTHFFIATRPAIVKAISCVFAITSGASAQGIIQRLTGTTSAVPPAAGTQLLVTPFDLNATANTVQRGVLINQPSLAIGDRLGFTIGGSPTNLNSLVITVELQV